MPTEATPAPLPPAPGAAAAEVWLERVRTSSPLPADLVGVDVTPALSADAATGDPVPPAATAWLADRRLLALLAVTCLAVGMVLGAVLFGGASDVPATGADRAAAPCAEIAAPAE